MHANTTNALNTVNAVNAITPGRPRHSGTPGGDTVDTVNTVNAVNAFKELDTTPRLMGKAATHSVLKFVGDLFLRQASKDSMWEEFVQDVVLGDFPELGSRAYAMFADIHRIVQISEGHWSRGLGI